MNISECVSDEILKKNKKNKEEESKITNFILNDLKII